MNEIAAFFHIVPWPPAATPLLWASVVLIVGALLGELAFRWLRWPRIVGYSAVGMCVAAAGFGLGDGPMPRDVRLVVDLALGLLLFELGSRVSLRWLRANPALLMTSVAESAATFAAVVVVLRWFDFEFNVALAGAALTMSTAGAVISRVSAEIKSAGQVTERMIVYSALNTLYAVLVLKLLIGWLHVDQRGDWIQGIAQPLYTFAGSVLVAALLAVAVAWAMKRLPVRDENSALLLLGLILLALAAARIFGLSTLLVPLLAGVVLKNASERPCIWPRHFGTAGGVLVLMLFVLVGSNWSVPMLVTGALAAGALLVARATVKGLVMLASARFTGIETRQGLALAATLTPLSATTLVLWADLQVAHPEIAERLAPLVFASIAIMAVGGPVLVDWGLRLAREHRLPAAPTSKGKP